MIKRSTLLLMLLYRVITVTGQDKEWKTEDINKDGVKDSIAAFYDGGSGFGGRWVEIIDGKTKEVLKMDTWRCFCRTKGYLLFPDQLLTVRNKLFLERIELELLGEIRSTPDAALNWILSGSFSLQRSDSNLDLFEYWFQYQPMWTKEKPINSNFYLPIHSDTLRLLYSIDGDMPEFLPGDTLTGGILMGGEVLGQYPDQPGLVGGDYEFYFTAHSIVVKNNQSGLWSYCFVTDYELTGAPEKMRWGSVKDLAVSENYLFIRHARGHEMDHFFIANFINGKCGQLRFTCHGDDKVNLSDGKIYYNDNPISDLNAITATLEVSFMH